MPENPDFFSWMSRGCCEADCPCEGPERKQKKTSAKRKYENLTDDDLKYIEAVRIGDVDTYAPMIKIAFDKAFPNTVVKSEVWRRDKSSDFNVFNIRRKDKSDAGWLGEGVYFYGSYEDARDAHAYGFCLRPFFIDIERPFTIDKPTRDLIAKANASGTSHAVTQITKDFDGVFYNGDMKEEWCVRSPCQIKLAGVTRDDAGQIIPLSYRFKRDNPDFRF